MYHGSIKTINYVCEYDGIEHFNTFTLVRIISNKLLTVYISIVITTITYKVITNNAMEISTKYRRDNTSRRRLYE